MAYVTEEKVDLTPQEGAYTQYPRERKQCMKKYTDGKSCRPYIFEFTVFAYYLTVTVMVVQLTTLLLLSVTTYFTSAVPLRTKRPGPSVTYTVTV